MKTYTVKYFDYDFDLDHSYIRTRRMTEEQVAELPQESIIEMEPYEWEG